MGPAIVAAVISDLHVTRKEENSRKFASHLVLDELPEMKARNPVEKVLELIKIESLKADILICPGDIAHKADPLCLDQGWNELHRIKEALGAKALVATAGNHDLDSRFQHDVDAMGFLTSLKPPFPTIDEHVCDRFWARRFVIIDDVVSSLRLVLINSSAYHGGKSEEIDHGRISLKTIDALKRELGERESFPFNIILCHHHPLLHQDLQGDDYDLMKNGQRLLEMLDGEVEGSWLVIHGHKHYPRLVYASGSSSSPVVFSAGSFSAKLENGNRNQFHLLSLNDNSDTDGIYGVIRTWDYASGDGWRASGAKSGLPALCGFGTRESPRSLVGQIQSLITGRESWKNLSARLPKIDFLTPSDQSKLKKELSRVGLTISYDEYGIPVEIGQARND